MVQIALRLFSFLNDGGHVDAVRETTTGLFVSGMITNTLPYSFFISLTDGVNSFSETVQPGTSAVAIAVPAALSWQSANFSSYLRYPA